MNRSIVGTGLLATFILASAHVGYIYLDPNGALIDSAGRGDRLSASIALSAGADVKFDFNASLRMAAQHGQFDMVKWLTEHGADIKNNGRIALKMAAFRNYHEIVDYLLARGADFIGSPGNGSPKEQYAYILNELSRLGHTETIGVISHYLENRGISVEFAHPRPKSLDL